LLRLARYLKHFKLHVSLGPACKLIEAIFELIVPLVMADIIDNGILAEKEDVIWQGGVKLIIFAVCGLSFTLVCQYLASVASQGVGTLLRRDLYSHINSLSYKELDRLGTPALVTRISNDVNQVQTAVAMLIRLVIRAPFLVIGATVMAMTIDLKLSLIFFGSMVAIIAIMYPVMTATVKLFKKQQKSLDGISRITRENLSGVRVVRAFARQEHEKQRFEESAEEYREFALKAGRVNALLNPAIFVVVNVAYLLIVYFGGSMVSVDGLTQGQVIALVNYMTQISLALVVVANLVTIFTKAAASSHRINEIFDTEPSVVGAQTMPTTDNTAPAIEFRDVSFSYLDGEGAEKSLENISFTLGKGEVLGIIGGTGSGKSTLVNLLARFYDATEGNVLINGADVRDYPDKVLRRIVGIVPQKTELLSGSLRENMTMGRNDITDDAVFAALETAQAKEFTDKLDGGLDARVLQGGKNFSGGQKQRLAIARAVAMSPEILILDDSSSALDYATDAALRKALKKLDMTCVIVSQRANSIRHADKIIVLDDGIAEGIGTHAQLLRECEVYREICLTQYTEQELEEQEKEG